MASEKAASPVIEQADVIAPVEEEPPVTAKTLIVVLAVVAVYFAQLVGLVGSGALARDITTVVGGSDKAVWLSAILTIVTVALGPPTSEAADYFGRKWFLVIQTACGCIGCIIVSRSTSIGEALGGQLITSISYAAQPLLHAVASEVLPRQHRPLAQSAVNVSAALGGIVGLLVGGTLTNNGHVGGFRPYFYMSAAIFAASALAVLLFYHPPLRDLQTTLTITEKLQHLDWAGYGLLTTGVVLFSIALSWSQNPYEWTNAHILAPFILGVMFLGIMIVYQWRYKKDGLFHHELFRSRNFILAQVNIFVEGLAFFASNNYFNYEMSAIYGVDAFHASLRYSVCWYVYLVVAVLAGIYCSRKKALRWPIVTAFVLIVVYDVLMATLTVNSSSAPWGIPVLLGAGMGICLNALVVVAQLSTPPHLISLASGLMLATRSMGGTFGVCIYNAIFNAALANLYSNVATAVIPLGAPEDEIGTLINALLNGETAELSRLGLHQGTVERAGEIITQTFLVAFRHVWIMAAAVASIAVISSIFIRDPTAEFNAHIDAPVEVGSKTVPGDTPSEHVEHSRDGR